jgi:MFS transporter, FSR family, fosmidomycin resistance protein
LKKSSTILTLSTLTHIFIDSFTIGLAIILAEIFGKSGKYFSVGIILAFFTLATAIAEPLWGKLSDIRGRRGTIVAAGLILSSLSFSSFGWIDPSHAYALPLFSLAAFLTGITAGTYHSVATSFLNENVEASQRGLYQGINNAGGSLGRTLAPLAIGFFISRFSLSAAFLPYIVFGVGLGALSMAMYPKTRSSAKGSPKPLPLTPALKQFILALAFLSFLRTAFFMTAMNFLPSYLMGFKGFTPLATGYFMTFVLATGIIAQPIGGRLSDLRDRAKLMALLLVLSGVSFSLFIFSPTAVSFACLAFAFFTLLMTFPILFALIGDFVPRNQMGLMTGLISGAGGISATILQFATGYFSELFPPPFVLLSLSVLPIMSAVIAFRLSRVSPNKVLY